MGWESDKASRAGLESAFFAASALSLAFSMADLAILKGQKKVTFPLSLIESVNSVNQSSKFRIKLCGFHAQVFDCFSRVFHCLFTGFSRSFHALFTLWVWSGICLKLWSPAYIYTFPNYKLRFWAESLDFEKISLNF